MGEKWKWWQILFSWTPKSLQTVTAAMKLKNAYSLEGKYDKPRQHIKKQRHHFADKGQSYCFSIVNYGYESWIIKKAENPRIDAFKRCWTSSAGGDS